jgi:P27 family predicted phage terminase small subunit
MRGRKPDPTALKILKNNPGRRPLNTREPKHPGLDAAVPPQLTHPEAIAEWSRIVETLGRGHVTMVDRGTLIAYCAKWAQWLDLETEAAQHAYLLRAPKTGTPMQNPALQMANKLLMTWLRLAVELGITPSSRARIVLADLTPGDSLDAFSVFQRKRARHAG